MTLLVWAPSAQRDIRRIELWLDKIDPRLAGRIVNEIERRAEQFLVFPLSGPSADRGPYRKLAIARFNYIVAYSELGNTVEIVRVRHAREDWLPR